MASGAAAAAVLATNAYASTLASMQRPAGGTVLALEKREVAPDAPVDHAGVAPARTLPQGAAVNDDHVFSERAEPARRPQAR